MAEAGATKRGRIVRMATAAALAATGLVAAGCGQGGQDPASGAAPPASAAPPQPPADIPLSQADAQAALQTLGQAPEQGFAPGAFGDLNRIAGLLQSSDPGQQAEGQRRLRRAVLAYARAQHGHGLDTSQFPKEWGLRPPAYDAAADLRAAQAQNRVPDWLKSLPPPEPRYQALVGALAAYRKIAAQGGWQAVPDGPDMHEGSQDPRVQAVRNRLAAEDPQVAAEPRDAPWDADLTQAVTRFQTRYGLRPTNVVDSATRAAMNVPIQARINQIRVNLERWRWMPRTLPATRIEVNVPSFALDYYQNGQVAMHMLAAAGKVHDQTPMLISTITKIELNPPWRVPADIARKELFPKEAKDPGYFAREQIVKGPSDAVPLVQKAGPKSALGQVKFEFENGYGVYLHDTPAKSAFDLHQRSVSHGCVRLQHAIDLAKALLQSTPGWGPDRVDQALQTTDTRTVTLAQTVPVMLLYWTAYVQDGQTYFTADPYSWDPLLLRLLDAPASGQG